MWMALAATAGEQRGLAERLIAAGATPEEATEYVSGAQGRRGTTGTRRTARVTPAQRAEAAERISRARSEQAERESAAERAATRERAENAIRQRAAAANERIRETREAVRATRERARIQEQARRRAAAQARRAARATPASRARAVQGLGPKAVTIPPPRFRSRRWAGEVGRYGLGPSFVAAAARGPAAETVTLAPPAHVTRRQVGLGLPSGGDVFEAVAGALGGALISAVFISTMKGNAKYVGAILTGGLGLLLASTSPLGTIPSELGMGAAAASGSWLYFDLTGQVPATTGAVWDPVTGEVRLAG